MKGVKYVLDSNNESGLDFISYFTRRIHLDPGETFIEPIRDTDIGFMKDWSDTDIKKYYEERYGDMGLTVTVQASVDNYP